MNSRIINLVGQLSAEAGSQLYLELKDILQSPHLILLDATKLESIDEIGWQFMKKCLSKIIDSQSKAAVSGLSQDFYQDWRSNALIQSIPICADRDSAKEYLASQMSQESNSNQSNELNSIQSQSKQADLHVNSTNTSMPKVSSFSTSQSVLPVKSKNPALYCPHCDSILRTYQMGNNACPSCKGKYFLHKDYKISSFEKVI